MPSDWRGCGHWTNQTRTLRESEGKCDQVSTTTRTTTRTTRTMKMLFIPPQRLASLWAQQECQANGRPAANSVARTCKQTTMTKGTQKNQRPFVRGKNGHILPTVVCVAVFSFALKTSFSAPNPFFPSFLLLFPSHLFSLLHPFPIPHPPPLFPTQPSQQPLQCLPPPATFTSVPTPRRRPSRPPSTSRSLTRSELSMSALLPSAL